MMDIQQKRMLLDAKYVINYKKMKDAWDAKYSKLKKSYYIYVVNERK